MVVFHFLVEMSCSVQHKHLQDEPHPLLNPPEPTLGLHRGVNHTDPVGASTETSAP